MTNQIWDTNVVPSTKQFEYFADGICGIFSELQLEPVENFLPFHARLNYCQTDNTSITHVQSAGYRVGHLSQSFAQSSDDDFYLNYLSGGKLEASQFENRTVATCGNFYILDNSVPFELNIADETTFRTHIVRIPRTPDLQRHREKLFGLNSTHNKHRLMPLLKLNLAQLSNLDEVQPDELDYFGFTISNLIELMVCDHRSVDFLEDKSGKFNIIMSEINRNFRNPDFNLDKLADNVGLSRRSLQSVLAAKNLNFSDCLLEKRLEFASSLLAQHSGSRSIEQIAYASGFRYLSTFYRAFQRRYNLRPGDLR